MGGRRAAGMTMALLLAALFILTLPQAHSIALGVNRASITFDEVLRGGYAETTIVITTDSEEPIDGEVIVEGEAAEWLNFSSSVFNFSRAQPYELRVFVQPPADAQIQEYQVNMSILTGTIAQMTNGRMGTSTRASFRVPVTIQMTGTERIACTVGGVQVMDTERGQPVELRLSVLNRGNVRINPDITVEVYDQMRASMLATRPLTFGERILPTVTLQRSRTFNADLAPNQYWAVIKVPMCDYSGLVTFDVLEPGGIKDDGDLIRIDAPAWANTGEIVPIKAIFRNKGARGVRASFKGTIRNVESGEIVKVIGTEEYVVDPDMTAEIQTFFNPQVGGQYEVLGKVYYNNKLTTERSTIINVNGAPVGGGSAKTIIILIGIAVAILVLLILIQRRKAAQRAQYGSMQRGMWRR